MIRNFFIMNSNGLIIFSDQYASTFEVDLMSGFISALYNFMQQTIFTNELDNIEVGGLRFIFEIQEMGKAYPIYYSLSYVIVPIILLVSNPSLMKPNGHFYNRFINKPNVLIQPPEIFFHHFKRPNEKLSNELQLR